jgi:SAM-dependent methyltransferase
MHQPLVNEPEIGPIRRLPYVDLILDRLQNKDGDLALAFGRHVHWGFWDDPKRADGSIADFTVASERLCSRLLGAGCVAHGHDVLDAGCGFGGTLATLNETLAPIRLHGINIDERQVARAVATVPPSPGNTIDFVHGDACRLPFADRSFDREAGHPAKRRRPASAQCKDVSGVPASAARGGSAVAGPRASRPERTTFTATRCS